MSKTLFIFDFDGTIADTHHYIVEISNRLAEHFHYSKIRPDEIEDLKDKTSLEIIRHLNVPWLKIPAIIAKGKKELERNITRIQPIAGLKEAVLQLKQKNFKLGILSSNSLTNIKQFLQNHQMDIFDFISSTSQVWSKDISFKKLIHQNNLQAYNIIYIGDEIRDIVAAKKLGMKIIAVGWGYNSSIALKRHLPDHFVRSPQELAELCESFI